MTGDLAHEPFELSAGRLRDALLAGELTVAEAVERALRRADGRGAELRAFLTVAHEQALARAAELDRLDAAARRALPLYGVPVAVKDELWTAGIRSTGGSRAFAGFVPDRDAVAVARLRAAGAVVVGKTNTAELGMSIRSRGLAEECRNPHDATRTAGGSSGGSAASVAAGIVPLALASDAGGSTRVPAALCGAVGLHPTVGRVPRDGDFGRSTHFVSVGPIARTVADAALALGVLAGHDPADPLSSRLPVPRYDGDPDNGRTLRVGWWHAPAAGPPVPAPLAAQARAAVGRLDGGPWSLEDASPPLAGVAEAFGTISDVDRAATAGPLLSRAARAALRPETRARLARGGRTRGVAYARALRHRAEAQCAAAELFARVDLLASPAVGTVAPPLLAPGADVLADPLLAQAFGFAGVANYLGCCAIAIPCGVFDGLPVGVQLMAPAHAEARLLAAARRLEQRLT